MRTVFDPPPGAEGRASFVPNTEAVMKMWARANEHERSVLGTMHTHYEGEIRRMVDEGNEPQNIAYTIHGLVDESVAHTLKTHPKAGQVRCRRGCSACCSLHVNVTRQEGVLLAGWIAMHGIEVNWSRVKLQATWAASDWMRQKPHERRCVFLGKDGECRVYEHRPTVCRKYMVVSDPRLCDTVRHRGAQVAILAPAEGEVLASAALGVLESGSLARMLLAGREALA